MIGGNDVIPIKFRGRAIETKELKGLIHGHLVETGELVTGYGIFSDPPAETDAKDGKNKWIRRTFIMRLPFPMNKQACWVDVAPESIELLVGYDSDGQEIYRARTSLIGGD